MDDIGPAGVPEVVRRYVRSLARYERLLDISRLLSATLNLDTLLEQIVRAAADLTGTEAASILLTARMGTLRFEASVDPDGVLFDPVEVAMDESIAGWVVTHGEPLLIADVRQEPRWQTLAAEHPRVRVQNMLAVPMRTQDKIIGCLEAVNKQADQAFTDEDVNTLTTLAAQAAIAVENVRLFEQSDLISEFVHELRTPLAAIKAIMGIVERPDVEGEQRGRMVNLIQEETARLTRMTNEFLSLARLESGRTRLRRLPVDVTELLDDAADTAEQQAVEEGIHLLREYEPVLPPVIVLGDDERLKQVVLNLLTNAIKYNSPAGDVRLRRAVGDGMVRVEVEDTGPGIHPADLKHIFDKFYRVPETEAYTQGTGLGLAISRRIVEGHGGSIGVESTPGSGTTFWFSLPLAWGGGKTT